MSSLIKMSAAFSVIATASIAMGATYSFQDGLNGYDGTQDTSLYAGDPTPGVNTGAAPTLYNNGVHRAIIRFDLTSLAGMTVTEDATLTLTMADSHTVAFSLYAISDDNAGWLQGSNPAYGPANAGDATYENKSHPGTPWVGGAGLAGAGGFDPVAVGTGVSGAYNTAINITLPASLIQHWIDGPNAGLVILSDELGQVTQFRSSDDTDGRPLLVINAVPEPASAALLGMLGFGLLARRRK